MDKAKLWTLVIPGLIIGLAGVSWVCLMVYLGSIKIDENAPLTIWLKSPVSEMKIWQLLAVIFTAILFLRPSGNAKK
jgi:hypothetical protein